MSGLVLPRRLLGALLLLVALFLPACINSKADSGVVNQWRAPALPEFERGKTTQTDVATTLGPPSQLVNLENQLVFYYLTQRTRTRGVILVVYNGMREEVVYDRAIFFFDKKGVLQDFALSLEETEYRPPNKKAKEKVS